MSAWAVHSFYRPDKWEDKLEESMPDQHRIDTRQMSLYDANT